jgi:phospholipid/cholesterol/gamma-HCH transport system substrate-binding protein
LTFIFLNEAFEGPSVTSTITGDGYTLTAEFDDTEVLPTKQPVLLRGLTVGKVKGVEFNKDDSTATVEFSIEDEYAPVYDDATVAVGERTVLGDPYLKLIPGSENAGEIEDGGEVRAVDSVDFDEALDFLDEDGRAHVKSTLSELRDATRSETGAQDVNNTVGGLTRTVAELRRLTDTLTGQEDELTALVSDSATVLDELGSREDAIRSIVAAGRVTLDALAANAEALDEGLAAAPGVLASAREALRESRPLLAETAPLIDELRKASPKLSGVLADLPRIMAETVGVTGRLSGVPTMRELLKVIRLIAPAVPGIEAAARNMQPLLAFTGARSKGIGNFFANLRGATAPSDADGHWLRTAAVLDPFLGIDVNGAAGCPEIGLCYNGYPGPGDTLDPQPYEPGSYPRLYPYDPPAP